MDLKRSEGAIKMIIRVSAYTGVVPWFVLLKGHPIFNQKFEILKSLGEGNTSKVYLGKELTGNNYCAIKILKEEFLRRDSDSILSVHNEITILKNLDHFGIIKMHEYGDAGTVVKPSGRVIENPTRWRLPTAPTW